MTRVWRAVGVAAATASVASAVATASVTVVRTAAAPAAPHFGDTFAYIVAVDVPESQAGNVRADNEVGPFTQVGPARVNRTISQGVARITVTQRLACLTSRCLPGPKGTAAVIPAARITVDGRAVAAPSLRVPIRSRITAAAVAAPEPDFRRPHELPPVSTRVRPVPAQIILSVGGVALLLAGFVAIAAPVRRGRNEDDLARRGDPVARAVRLLRESATRDSRDRRRAASLASRVVGNPEVGDSELAVAAARVAWSRSDPSSPAATTLADRVERGTSGRE